MKEALPTGAVISHYRVLARLGAGGMGVVYLAEDIRLGRKVALKLLPPEYLKDEEKVRRFEQEARAASALNHPNILTIYEIGLSGAAHYIATEFIEGQTLRQRLNGGKLPVGEALDIAIQIAGALRAAHDAGIVHRDIKPENIMIRPDGYVKVLDFGIAKLTEATAEPEAPTLLDMTAEELRSVKTDPGIVLGSPNYMSPEQARGLPVDARTDIFSLGIMLYEMLAGRKPFDGATVSDIIAALLEREPRPLCELVPETPERVERIVRRALAKDREARYQTSHEMLRELRRQKQRLDFEAGLEPSLAPEFVTQDLSGSEAGPETSRRPPGLTDSDAVTVLTSPMRQGVVTGVIRSSKFWMTLTAILALALAFAGYLLWPARSPQIDSLAVLPFVNQGNDPNNEYLSDGITESLINNLSQWRNLRVMSRSSVFRYKGRDVDPREVGREMGVRAVLMGRVVQQGDSLNVSVELIDTADNAQVWGEQYRRRLSEIFAVQDEIARAVSDKLRLRLTDEEVRRMTKRYTANAEAYQLYLRGRYHWNRRTEEGLRRGIDYFRQAIGIDPNYALAYAGLADCYVLLGEYTPSAPGEAQAEARAAAMRAVSLDDSLAEAHTSLGAVYENDWRWRDAEDQYRRAIELNPGYATAHHWYGALLSNQGRHEAALAEIRRALELDPLSLIINTAMGRVYYNARRYDEAMAAYRKALELDANFAEARFQLALALAGTGRQDEAVREMRHAVELFADPTMTAWVALVEAQAGRQQAAESALAEALRVSQQQNVQPYSIASAYAALGDRERAYEWLEKAFAARSTYITWLKVDPAFDEMRGESRFAGLLERAGFAL